MAIELKINARGSDVIIQRIQAMKERLSDFTQVNVIAAATFEAMIQESFQRSQSPNGEAWAPLAPSTVARRRGTTATPLVDTGQLRRSLFSRPDRQGFTFGVSGAAATYAPTHQFGRGAIPRRSFLPLDLDGELDLSSGRAAEWRARTLATFRTYITTGELRA